MNEGMQSPVVWFLGPFKQIMVAIVSALLFFFLHLGSGALRKAAKICHTSWSPCPLDFHNAISPGLTKLNLSLG